MSDFLSSGWSVFIATATVVGLIACLFLLLFASRRKTMAKDNSTGHVFDEDLVEMNNPLPLWWVVLFVLTVLFALIYMYAFPALGSTPGWLGWTSRGELEADQARVAKASAKIYDAYTAQSAEALSRDPGAMAIGQRLFINNCAACHGSDARGSKGFPDLTDNDWLHGGTPEKIEETITLGRTGVMPPMAAAVGSSSDVHNVANYVLSLSGDPHDPIAAASGKAKFAVCAACHGAEGKGNQAIGAPNLTDKIWLHGWGEDAIVAMVERGKTNVMPAQAGRLTPAQIHLLASYVWSLSQSHQTAAR
jgi:cytochrome c oxidase cbb3-type subunit 3